MTSRGRTAITAALLGVGLASAELGSASYPGSNGVIAFGSGDANMKIYTVGARGGTPKLLIAQRGTQSEPAWSRDGRRIAFVAFAGSTQGVYVANASGGSIRRLTGQAVSGDAPVLDARPQWSPDGRSIVFERSTFGTPRHDVMVMRADGSRQRKLLERAYQPKWSPDGKKLVVAIQVGESLDLHLIRPDGTRVRRLTNDGGFAPDWSPDGRTIAFVTGRDGNKEIYVMRADGSRERRLTRNGDYDYGPVWSPDGRQIAFESRRAADQSDLYVMRRDGSGERRLTKTAATESDPAWRPVPRRS